MSLNVNDAEWQSQWHMILMNDNDKDLRAPIAAKAQEACCWLSVRNQCWVHIADSNDVWCSSRRDGIDSWKQLYIAVSVSALLSCLMATLRIRFNDRNTVDVAQLRAAMDSFLARVTALFVNRKACSIHCYTHAASWLFHREGNIHNAQSECECRQFRHLFIY